MPQTALPEPCSGTPRPGRPRSARRRYADEIARLNLTPDDCRCPRSQLNYAYRLSAIRPALQLLTADEQTALFSATADQLGRGGFPRGWSSVALELGRLLDTIQADDETARDLLMLAVTARRDGVSWGAIRSHFRAMRLGKRQGNALSLSRELARTDDYRSRFPGTTDQMVIEAARNLLDAVSESDQP